MKGRRHPRHPSMRLPEVFLALGDHLRDTGRNDADGAEYLLCPGWVEERLFDPTPEDADPRELGGAPQPVEIVPFGWAGGGGIHYGWVVLAPELDLDDFPCVFYAALDGVAYWLGDNTRQAFENLLLGRVAEWECDYFGQRGRSPAPYDTPQWTALCEALALRPDLSLAVREARRESDEIGPDARSARRIRPTAPPGWRYEPTRDGIGVLAPESAFDPASADDECLPTIDMKIDRASALLAAGHPASALHLLRNDELNDYLDEELTRQAYLALGRTMHADRLDVWLRLTDR
ncbi:hypothetical protein [Virgisporangium aliadipatigenens]|nr:hypothetical protein [Virgisporangium aliadipatigenens]